jgi:hypothetical protein
MCTDLLATSSNTDDATCTPEERGSQASRLPPGRAAPCGFAFEWLLAEATTTGWSCPDDHWLE